MHASQYGIEAVSELGPILSVTLTDEMSIRGIGFLQAKHSDMRALLPFVPEKYYNSSVKTSMGVAEMPVGLTEKAIRLDLAMRAGFREFITEGNLEEIMVEKGALEAVKRHFDGLWERAGVKRSPVYDGIIGALTEGPKTLEEIFEFLKGDPDFDDFRDLDRKTFAKAAKAMFEAGLLTVDERKMWVLE